MEVFMKRIHFIPVTVLILCYALAAGGCGTGDGGDAAKSENSITQNIRDFSQDEEYSGGLGDETAEENSESSESSEKETSDNATGNDNSEINTDMLVYTCDLAIDTLDYNQSVQTFRNMLTAAGGFVENENFTDGQSSTSYYIEEQDKNKTYTATVRVPHDKYNDFLNGADQLGDVRSRSSNVANMAQEYSDLGTTLQIYEAKEKRYIEMLSTIKDDAQALNVEKELTELQVKIATLKTRMNQIRTDVAYSTINIRIHEVAKYEERNTPKRTDTFLERLGNTLRDTWKTFLAFLEALLFFTIRVSPYLIIILCILIIIYRIQKSRNSRREDQEPPTFPIVPPDEIKDADEQTQENTESDE